MGDEYASPIRKQFGDSLKEPRENNKLTQKDLANKVGVNRNYMDFLKQGEKNPTLKNLVKIANALISHFLISSGQLNRKSQRL